MITSIQRRSPPANSDGRVIGRPAAAAGRSQDSLSLSLPVGRANATNSCLPAAAAECCNLQQATYLSSDSAIEICLMTVEHYTHDLCARRRAQKGRPSANRFVRRATEHYLSGGGCGCCRRRRCVGRCSGCVSQYILARRARPDLCPPLRHTHTHEHIGNFGLPAAAIFSHFRALVGRNLCQL